MDWFWLHQRGAADAGHAGGGERAGRANGKPHAQQYRSTNQRGSYPEHRSESGHAERQIFPGDWQVSHLRPEPAQAGFFMLIPPWRGCLFSILTNRLYHAQPAALWRVPSFQAVSATLKADRTHSRALACHSMAKKIFRRQKSHYTAPACGFWIIKFFQFYFSSNQTARPRYYWRLRGKPKLKRLKRISVFFTFKDL